MDLRREEFDFFSKSLLLHETYFWLRATVCVAKVATQHWAVLKLPPRHTRERGQIEDEQKNNERVAFQKSYHALAQLAHLSMRRRPFSSQPSSNINTKRETEISKKWKDHVIPS